MMRLRQVALVAADLAAAEAELSTPFEWSPVYRDPGVGVFGLHNVLYRVGDRFVEIVSPTTDGTTAGRLLERRGGDGGYMVIVQTDDLEAARRRIADADVRIVFTAEGEGVTGLHLHPSDVGGAILSIDECVDAADWPWAGPNWLGVERRDPVVSDLVGVTIQVEDPTATAARWAETLGVEVRDATVVVLDDAELRFAPITDGRGPGVAAVDLVAADRTRVGEQLDLVGTVMRLV